jgi:chromosome segregation ATPase
MPNTKSTKIAPDPLAAIRTRLAERETQIQNLQPQIQRNEQFGNELRGKLFTAQSQHAELTDLLKSLTPDAAPPQEEPPK